MTITPNASQEVTIYEDTDLLTIGHFYNNCNISYRSYNLARYLTKGTNIDDVDYNYTWSNGDTELTITAKLPDVDLQASRMLVNPTLSSGSTTTITCFKNNTQGTDVAVVNLVFSINGSINDFTGVMVTCIEILEASGGGVPGPTDPRALGNDKIAQTGIQFSSVGTTTLTGGTVTVVNNSLATIFPILSTIQSAANTISVAEDLHLIRRFVCNGNDANNNGNYAYDLLCNPTTNIINYSNNNANIRIGTGYTSNFTSYDLDTCSFRKEADFYGYVGYCGIGGTTGYNTNGSKTIQHFIGRYKLGGNLTRNVYNICRYTCKSGTLTGTPQGLSQTEVDTIVKKVEQMFGNTTTSTTAPNGKVYTGFANSPSLIAFYNYTDANCYTKGNGTEVIGITSRTYNNTTADNTGGYTYVFDPLIIPDATTVKEMAFYGNNTNTTIYKSNITSTGFKVRVNVAFKSGLNYPNSPDALATIHLFQSYDSQGNLLA